MGFILSKLVISKKINMLLIFPSSSEAYRAFLEFDDCNDYTKSDDLYRITFINGGSITFNGPDIDVANVSKFDGCSIIAPNEMTKSQLATAYAASTKIYNNRVSRYVRI